MKDLPVPLHVREEDILRILNIPDVKHLLFEVRYLTKYIEEEIPFKVRLSIQAGRSEAKMLKKSSKVHEPPAPSSKVPSKQKSDDPPALLKKKKLEGISTSTGQVLPDPSPSKLHVPRDVLKHRCLGRRKADDLIKLVEAQATITQLLKDQKVSGEKVVVLEAEKKKSRTLIIEKDAALFGLESSRVNEDFKNSTEFKTIIQDHLQEAWDHIYDVEVKRKAGVKIDGLTTSHTSEDPSSDLDGAEIESVLRQAFSSDDESIDVE
ncbi:hypothetical protein IEQ34_001943 [Dendrobium chrysotoxum]|uniref:Uncharacterized protein n=1 Tax=Dendrobium chrysotoxum TaxID=161865 RepID=A0AAV7HJG0_DENCH|nr:hypothetical protein IEQ34_001943 [Dendrobium chrysotoxum]